MPATDNSFDAQPLNAFLNHLALMGDDVGIDQPSSRLQEPEGMPDGLALFFVIEMMQRIRRKDGVAMGTFWNEVLKLTEITDAEFDSCSQMAQPGSCQIDHGIRSIDTDLAREEIAPEICE